MAHVMVVAWVCRLCVCASTYNDGLVPLGRLGVLIVLGALQHAVAHLSLACQPRVLSCYGALVCGGVPAFGLPAFGGDGRTSVEICSRRLSAIGYWPVSVSWLPLWGLGLWGTIPSSSLQPS